MIAALLLAVTTALPSGQTAITNISSNGIQEWRVDRDRGIWIRSIKNQWHYAEFAGRCPRAIGESSLGFEGSALDQLDRYSTIRAGGSRCRIFSLVRSEAPPKRK